MALEARENSRDALTRFRLPNLKITLKLKSKITSQSCFAVAELYCRSGMGIAPANVEIGRAALLALSR